MVNKQNTKEESCSHLDFVIIVRLYIFMFDFCSYAVPRTVLRQSAQPACICPLFMCSYAKRKSDASKEMKPIHGDKNESERQKKKSHEKVFFSYSLDR